MTPAGAPPAPLGMAAATAAYTAGGDGGKGSARTSFRSSGRVSMSARPASSAPVGHTAGSVATTSAALGLRRTSWQHHLPPRLQRAFTKVAVIMDGPVVLCIVVLATLVAIFLEDIKGHCGRIGPLRRRAHKRLSDSGSDPLTSLPFDALVCSHCRAQ